MEAFLFTLDVFFLVLLIRSIRKLGLRSDQAGSLGVFAFLEKKTDETSKGMGLRKGRQDA